MYRLCCGEGEVTYGQRCLLDLVGRRGLARLCRDRSVSFNYAYQVAVGMCLPPARLIYALRGDIHPALWFWRERDERPEERPFARGPDGPWDYTASAAFRELRAVADSGGLRGWALRHGFDYTTVYLIAAGRRAPSFLRMCDFRDLIYPAGWFCP